ncbi:MAG: VWA-like domain-containing protein [Bacillota bacterium]
MIAALEQIKARVLDRYPYFGSVAAGVRFKESCSVEAFGTDGKTFYCNPKSPERFSKDELGFLFAHELCHLAFQHIERSRGKDLRLWGLASDAVVNALLLHDGFTPAPGAVLIPEALDCDAEQLYLMLLEETPFREEAEKRPQNAGDASRSSSDSSSDSGADEDQQGSGSDSKDSTESERGNKKSKAKRDDQSGGAPAEDASDLHADEMGSLAHSLWDKPAARETGGEEDDAPSEHAEEETDDESTLTDEQRVYRENKIKRRNQLAELKDSLSNQATGAGTSSNADLRQTGSIGSSKPLVDWRRALREEICFDVDWSYKNAVLENGVVIPHLEELPYPVTEILLDTSGSIEEALLKSFLRECKGILQSSQLRVGCFDIMFYGFQEVRKEADIDELAYKGGGGTNFNAAVNAFSRRVTNKIIFTDGDAEMPDTPMDAIWVVFGNQEICPRGGRVVYITPEQLQELQLRGG